MSHKVMQQALDAFEAGTYAAEEAAIFALREELAKPEDTVDWKAEYLRSVDLHNETLSELREALLLPEQRQPLTTPQYVEALGPLLYQAVCSAGTLRRIVRALEAAHGIKEQP